MTLLAALAVGATFGAGAWLLMSRSRVRMAAGVVVLTGAANLFILGATLPGQRAPVLPILPEDAADPVLQALVLTAIVIGLGLAALVLALAFRAHAGEEGVPLGGIHGERRGGTREAAPRADGEEEDGGEEGEA